MLILASSYVGARSIFFGQTTGGATLVYGAVANPAVAIGIQMSTLFNHGFSAWQAIYIYPTVPFGGAFLAVLFFELVFKKASLFVNNEDLTGDDSDIGEGQGGDIVHDD